MAGLQLTLLGGVQLRRASGTAIPLASRKAQALLAYLALRRGQPQPRDALAALLWGDSPAGRARHSLRQALVALRRALPRTTPPALVETGDVVALDPRAIAIDVDAFKRLVAAATPQALEDALALYRGDLAAGLDVRAEPFEEWLVSERERLRELALEAHARLLRQQADAGATDRAIQTAGRLLALDPLQEAVHRALMTLYARQGRRGAALRQYQKCVETLQRELGAEPEAETRRLYREILQSGPPPTPARAGAADAAADNLPLVGRADELERLRAARARAWHGTVQVAMILGETGVGKSRLVAELAADTHEHGGRVLLGRAWESGQIIPFGPWVDAVRTGGVLAEIGLADLAPASRADLARLFPELPAGGRRGPAAGDEYARMFEALAGLFEVLAARQPLVLALEDLHWADEMSLRLLSALSRRVRTCPLLVAGTAREDELVDAPALRRVLAELDRERRLTRVPLARLPRADTLALVQALARPGIGAPAVQRLGEQVWAASAGNPFVAVETIRAVREGTVPATGAALGVAPRVRDVIATRLDRLDERARAVAAVAAAIGREFEFPLLVRAAGLDGAEAAAGVEALVARRLVQVVGEQLDFAHERIREVVYEGILPPRRRLLHERVGQALEALYADRLPEVYDRLAFHYARSDDAERAVTYLARVAEKANETFASEEALAALAEALAHVEQLPAGRRERRRLEVLVRRSFSLSVLGRFHEILALLEPHREPLERLDDPALAGPYFLRLGLTHSYLGDQGRAALHARRALDEATRGADAPGAGKALYVVGLAEYWSGRPRQGLACGRQAVTHLEGAQEPHWLGLAHYVVGLNHYVLGEFDAALAAEAQVEALGAAVADPRLRSFAAYTTAMILAARGDWESAIATGRRALERSQDPINTAIATGRLAGAYLEAGDAGAARPLLERAIGQVAPPRLPQLRAQFTTLLGEAHLIQNEPDRARQLVTQGLEIAREAAYPYGIAWAQRALGRVALATDAHREAATCLHDALATFDAMPAPFEAARTRLVLAALARGTGGDATAHLANARTAFTALGASRWVEITRSIERGGS